jgi:hypothetical protein
MIDEEHAMPIEPLPTLIIGLGGTGGQVARALKLAVRAANGGRDHDAVRFLIINAHRAVTQRPGSMNRLAQTKQPSITVAHTQPKPVILHHALTDGYTPCRHFGWYWRSWTPRTMTDLR